jgi:hypothetical protein
VHYNTGMCHYEFTLLYDIAHKHPSKVDTPAAPERRDKDKQQLQHPVAVLKDKTPSPLPKRVSAPRTSSLRDSIAALVNAEPSHDSNIGFLVVMNVSSCLVSLVTCSSLAVAVLGRSY